MNSIRIAIRGHTRITVRDHHGNIRLRRINPNIIVDGFLAFLAGVLSGDEAVPTDMKYIAIGESDDPPEGPAQVALEDEVMREEGAPSRVTSEDGVANDTYKVTATFMAGEALTIVEAGLFDDDNAGTMACRQTFSAVELKATDELEVEWFITFGRGA